MTALRRTILVFLMVFVFHSVCGADNSVLSMAYGLGALNSLAKDGQLRKAIELSDEQFLDVQKALREKLVVGEEKNNAFAREFLGKLLSREQRTQLRIAYIKKRFKTPLNLLDSDVLTEVGLTQEEVESVARTISPLLRSSWTKLDKLRIEALKEAFSPFELDVLWRFVGKDLVVENGGVSWENIVVFREVTIDRQITLSIVMVLPNELQLSIDQRAKLLMLSDSVQLKETKGEVLPSKSELSSQLDGILQKSQRFAIVQRMQQQILRNDLTAAVRPEVTKHFRINDAEIEEVRAALSEAQKHLEQEQLSDFINICKAGLKVVPVSPKNVIEELVDGVWVLN